jgi:hypothetical protein
VHVNDHTQMHLQICTHAHTHTCTYKHAHTHLTPSTSTIPLLLPNCLPGTISCSYKYARTLTRTCTYEHVRTRTHSPHAINQHYSFAVAKLPPWYHFVQLQICTHAHTHMHVRTRTHTHTLTSRHQPALSLCCCQTASLVSFRAAHPARFASSPHEAAGGAEVRAARVCVYVCVVVCLFTCMYGCL